MTTADQMSADLFEGCHRLEAELNIPVKVVLRKEMMKTLSDGLMTKMSGGKQVIE